MTAICGILCDGIAYVGADSFSGNEYRYHRTRYPKVFINGEYVIAYTTSFRMGQLIQFANLPEIQSGEDIFRHMVTSFIPAIKEVMKSGGFMKTDNGVDTGGAFIVGVRDSIFTVDDDFQVNEPAENYVAHGSGIDFLYGSLATTPARYATPEDKIKLALESAEKHCPTVCGPFNILSTRNDR